QCLIDIFSRSNALLEHVKRLVSNHRIDTAGDESGGLLNHNHFLAHSQTNFGRGGDRLVISLERTNYFEQLHFVYRIEKVHAHALPRTVGYGCNLSHT